MILKIATLDRVNRKADRSISISFTTSTEQTNEELAALDRVHQKTCVLAIKPDESAFPEAEMKELDALDVDLYDKPKTKSQRLRNTLYVLHTQSGGNSENFPDFYSAKMEALIDHFKSKLEA